MCTGAADLYPTMIEPLVYHAIILLRWPIVQEVLEFPSVSLD
jgi:hypothetical protein